MDGSQKNQIFDLIKENINKIESIKQNKDSFKKEVIEKNLSELITNYSILLSNGIKFVKQNENEKSFWTTYIYGCFFNSPILKFCQFINKASSSEEKGKIWIRISIIEGTFFNNINMIYEKMSNNYTENSILLKNKKRILELTEKLNKINFSNYKDEIFEEYKLFLNGVDTPRKNSLQNDVLYDEIENESELDILYKQKENQDMVPFFDNNIDSINVLDLDIKKESSSRFCSIKEIVGFFEPKFSVPKARKSITEIEPYKITNKINLKNYIENNFYDFRNDKDDLNLKNCSETNPKKGLILNPKNNNYLPYDIYYDRDSKNKSSNKNEDEFDSVKSIYKFSENSNSTIYYYNNYYKKQNSYKKFIEKKNQKIKPFSLKHQNYQCFFCKKPFKTFFGFPFESIYWCSYYMKYSCGKCISQEFSIIPDFIFKEWSFKKFSISKRAYNMLKEFYSKPVITSKINYFITSDTLKIFRMKKRRIQIIYDLMKCNDMDKIINEVLKNYKYFVLKEELYSLKDIVEINNRVLLKKLDSFFLELKEHVMNCDVCNYKGSKCINADCKKDEILFVFDVDKVDYCIYCKGLYHRDCKLFHICEI